MAQIVTQATVNEYLLKRQQRMQIVHRLLDSAMLPEKFSICEKKKKRSAVTDHCATAGTVISDHCALDIREVHKAMSWEFTATNMQTFVLSVECRLVKKNDIQWDPLTVQATEKQ